MSNEKIFSKLLEKLVESWIRSFVDNEIDISLKDAYGRTAEDIAVEVGGRDTRFVRAVNKFKDELRMREYRIRAIMAGQGLGQ